MEKGNPRFPNIWRSAVSANIERYFLIEKHQLQYTGYVYDANIVCIKNKLLSWCKIWVFNLSKKKPVCVIIDFSGSFTWTHKFKCCTIFPGIRANVNNWSADYFDRRMFLWKVFITSYPYPLLSVYLRYYMCRRFQ